MVNGTGISFSGLASGLDTTSIVQQLVALERIPIQLVQAQRQEQQDKLDLVNQFADLVTALQDTAKDLGTRDGFYTWAVGGDFADAANITASGGAAVGPHTLDIQALARTDRWAFDGVADPSTDLASANGEQVSFSVGSTSYSIALTQDTSSLNDVADAINESAGDDVSATVVNTGTETSPSYQLVLASTTAGEDARISGITSNVAGLTIDGAGADAQGDPTSANHLSVGSNAVAIIDGLTITRSTNDFSDVFEGVSIDIQSAGQGEVTFNIDPDKEAIRGTMDEFVTKYNEVIDFMNTQNTVTPIEGEGEGNITTALFGDSLLTSVRSTVRNSLFDVPLSVIQADTTGFSTLSTIGISTDSDGRLEIDDEKFNEKLLEDIDAFADLFIDSDGFVRDSGALENTPEYYVDTSADSGLMADLERSLSQLFGNLPDGDDSFTLRGLFDLKRDSITDQIDRLNDSIEVKERRIIDFENDLILRFARLEQLMGSLNAQGAALSSTLGQL
jgi:flagellar hook-associated protein 2